MIHIRGISWCNYTLDEQASQIFDELPNLAISVSDDIESNLVYTAGYITRKVDASVEDSFMFFENYGSYTERLSRGGLKIHACDSTREWSVFCFIMFDEIKNKICRNCLMKIFRILQTILCADQSLQNFGKYLHQSVL